MLHCFKLMLKRRTSHSNMPVTVCADIIAKKMTGTTSQTFLALFFFFCPPPIESPALSGVSSSLLLSSPFESLPELMDASVRLSSAT